MAQRGRFPFLRGASGNGLGQVFRGANKALRSTMAPVVSRLRQLRLFVFSFALGVGFGRRAVSGFRDCV